MATSIAGHGPTLFDFWLVGPHTTTKSIVSLQLTEDVLRLLENVRSSSS